MFFCLFENLYLRMDHPKEKNESTVSINLEDF